MPVFSPLFFLCVRTDVCYAVVGCFIVQKEKTEDIQETLNIFKVWNHDWMPSHVMVDKSNMVINALKTEFPAMELLEKINNSEVEPGEELDVVESLVGKKRMKGQIHCQVKWQSYPPEFNTWEAHKNLFKWLGKSTIQEPAKNHTDQVVGAVAGVLTRWNGAHNQKTTTIFATLPIHCFTNATLPTHCETPVEEWTEDIEANIFTHNDGFRNRSPDNVHFNPLTADDGGQLVDTKEWRFGRHKSRHGYLLRRQSNLPLRTSKSPTPVSVQERNVYYSPTCVVCLENPPVEVVWPCRHACLCRPCARRLKVASSRCPEDPESEAERRPWEEFQEDMAVLDSLDRIMDDPGKSEEEKAEARRKYEDYAVRLGYHQAGTAGEVSIRGVSLTSHACSRAHIHSASSAAGEAVSYFRNSFKPNLGELSRFFRLFGMPDVKTTSDSGRSKRPKDTKWLSHDEACSSLYNTLPAVLTSLDHKAPASIKLQDTAAADPQVNSGQLVHCPFNPALVVKCCKVEDHFRKCSKDNASARDEIAHNIARNGQRRRYRRASRYE
ncbi:hypothetical protein Bbelb_048550 [Branchiostoma belcheri]|nr:hypothetical protein Bbelb_048550 [Branchiostoma belcheri]